MQQEPYKVTSPAKKTGESTEDSTSTSQLELECVVGCFTVGPVGHYLGGGGGGGGYLAYRCHPAFE